jgi:amino-acid N-acetyltransferase
MIPDITPATTTDLPAIFALLDANKLPRAALERHIASTLVAREDGQIVGTAALELYGRAALLRSVAVDARLRGRGLGQALTTRALDLARRRGVRIVYLLTETAAEFFPKFGFRPTERVAVDPAVLASEEFASACPNSAAVMMKPLTPNP